MRYAIVIERGPTSYGAYVPDLPGCVAAAETREEVVKLIREAIEFHLEEMRGGGPRDSETILECGVRRGCARLTKLHPQQI